MRCKIRDDMVIEIGKYTERTNATVRQTAMHFGISKSSVHTVIKTRLSELDHKLAESTEDIMAKNKAERHIRGGISTKEKYMKLREQKITA